MLPILLTQPSPCPPAGCTTLIMYTKVGRIRHVHADMGNQTIP